MISSLNFLFFLILATLSYLALYVQHSSILTTDTSSYDDYSGVAKVATNIPITLPKKKTGTSQLQEQHDYPFDFAGCLITRDDKMLLPEWLAYHYTVLPLRYLIVAIDPRSLTSPESILDMWQNYTNLKVEIWKGNWFWRMDSYENPELSPPTTVQMKLQVRDERQADFYKFCLLRLNKLNYTWTAIIDTDEFFTYNTPMKAEKKKQDSARHGILSRKDRRRLFPSTIGRQNETIAHAIQKYGGKKWSGLYNYNETALCAPSPRLQFFSKHVKKELIPPNPFGHLARNYSFHLEDYQSLQFTAHDRIGGGSFAGNKVLPSKTMINAALAKPEYLVTNPHTIYHECGDPKRIVHLQINEGWPLRVHQYSASLKSFVSRPDRTREVWEERNRMEFENTYDNSITTWFPEFVKLMERNDSGVDLAYQLTQQAYNDAYAEATAIKHRTTNLNETVPSLFVWDKPLLSESEKLEMLTISDSD